MRTTFYLSPHPNGGWLGKQDSEEHYIITSPNKQDVLEHLLNLCETRRPCTIVIQNEKGEFIEECTYGTLHYPE